MRHWMMVSFFIWLIQCKLSYLGKLSKAKDGKFWLKFQILLMLQWLHWYLSTWGEGELPLLLRCLTVSADASSNQTCRRRHVRLSTRERSGTSRPQHHPAAAAGDTWPHRSWPVAAKHSRSEPRQYKIRGVMPRQVYKCRLSNVDELKQRLVEVWDDLHQTVIDSAVSQWRQRLRACITFWAFVMSLSGRCLDWKNLFVNIILFNVVYPQNNMSLITKFVIFVFCDFPR